MFKYSRFDFTIKKTNKLKYLFISFIIITLLVYNIYITINNDVKDDVKIISSNSRRIINNLDNYTETMSDFIVSNDENQFNEIKKIRLSIDYLKLLKELEIKEKELKEKLFKEQELKEKELNEKKIREELKEKAINLIKSYIPNYNSLIKLASQYLNIDGYSNDTSLNCFKELIEINNEELFEQLIDIDYDNFKVSFNYLDKNESYFKDTNNIITSHLYSNYDKNNKFYKYSHYIYKNYKENIIKNPIYKIIKDKLELEDYTEPNLDKYYYDEYNNKSKYFTRSLNDFSLNGFSRYSVPNRYNLIKFSHNYTNNIKYEYYYNGRYSFIEFININEVIINNPNPIEIYKQKIYKNICNINSRTYENLPYILTHYSNSYKYYTNIDCSYYSNRPTIAIGYNNLENILNNNLNECSNKGMYGSYNVNEYIYELNNNKYYYYDYNINDYIYKLNNNIGSRFFKNNLTKYLPNTVQLDSMGRYNHNHYSISDYTCSYSNIPNCIIESMVFNNYYFIEKIYINFPEIIIYDEYDYIQQIVSNIANIYNLPIIPPISFI